MGDETAEFASRFSSAVTRLTHLAGEETHAELRRAHGARLTDLVRDALDAVEAVYETGTKAVRNWPEQRRLVLAKLATVREALGRRGVDDELRRLVRELLELLEPRSPRA